LICGTCFGFERGKNRTGRKDEDKKEKKMAEKKWWKQKKKKMTENFLVD